ncbi:hypothetical protein WMF30_05260 [Sorangium sp. So ce134]
MKKRRCMWIGTLGLVGGAVACGNVEVVPDEPDRAGECAAVEDCTDRASACRVVVACEQGACVVADAADGTPVAEQTPGDCQQAVCDGSGEVKTIADEDDAPDDGNACTLDTCDGAAPVHTAQAEVACATGLPGSCALGVQRCDADGRPVGGCAPASAEAERCDAEGRDEDCDGLTNEEGEGCSCGDGYVSGEEECDDGNTTSGDRCSATCRAETALQISAGLYHTCALLNGGAVKCWGRNTEGQLGLGDTEHRGDAPGEMGAHLPAVDLGTDKTATAIAAGARTTCALLNDGSIKCWGAGFGEPIGDEPDEMGDNLPPVDLGTGKTATAIAVSSASDVACALLSDGSLKCWGDGSDGALGTGDAETRGDNPGEMGDALRPIDLGAGKTATAVATGVSHTCALLSDGSAKCWGDNSYGQLGVVLDGTCYACEDPPSMGDRLPAVDLGTGKKAIAMAAGREHSCAALDDGSVKCWGFGSFGQLGLGEVARSAGPFPDAMGDNLPPVDLGTGAKATAVAAGYYHSCALLGGGSVKCWGYNGTGALGLGDTASRGSQSRHMGDALPAVDLGAAGTAKAITAGAHYTCALLGDGSVKCWGDGGSGQLGLGRPYALETGDSLPTVKLYADAW